MRPAVDEFLRRFLLHLLPRGFLRIRNFGFLANRQRATLLPLCFRLLQTSAQISTSTTSSAADHPHSLWNCPVCAGTSARPERLSEAQLLLRSPPLHGFRRMNPQLHHRITLLPRHVQKLCVSLHSGGSAHPLFHLCPALQRDAYLDQFSLKLPRPAAKSNGPNHRHMLSHIQIP